ncbi:MAG: hypothetical protein QW104_00595 [Nitrososphaerota archaeon]
MGEEGDKMIALQAFPDASQGQLLGILQLLIAIAIALALAIVAIAVLSYPRSVRRVTEEAQIPEAPLEEERSVPRPSLNDVSMKIVWMLDKAEAIPIENVKHELSEYEELLGDAVSSLIESEVIQVSGGMLVLTEKGRKLIELAREKRIG